MPAPLQNVRFPLIEQAEVVMQQALVHYYALQQMAQQEKTSLEVLDELRVLYRQTQPTIRQQLRQSLLPPETLARLGIAWDACEQEYDGFSFVFGEYDDGVLEAEELDRDAFSLLLTQIQTCAFNLNAAIADHRLQKKYWDDQAERRVTLEAFLTPDDKETWVIKTLLEAQRAVADAYYEALKCERTPDYVEASRLLNEAWRIYREAASLHAQQERVENQLTDNIGFRDLLIKLEQIDETVQSAIETASAQNNAAQKAYLENLKAEGLRHRESLRLHISLHQRALSEDITPPESLACEGAITALHATVRGLTDPAAQRDLQRLLSRQQGLTDALTAAMTALQAAMDGAESAQRAFNDTLGRLDGAGFDRQRLSKWWKNLQKEEQSLQKLRDEHRILQGQGQALGQQARAATTPALLTAVRDPIKNLIGGPVPTLQSALEAHQTTATGKTSSAQGELTAMSQQLTTLQAAIQTAETELKTRLSWFHSNNPPIPGEYIASKQALLDDVMALGSVRNVQALEAAKSRLDVLVAGGTDSEFPKQPQAMAIFSKTFGTGANLQNRMLSMLPSMLSATDAMNNEAAQIATGLTVIDLKALQAHYSAASLDIKTTFPAWDAALEDARATLVSTVKASGPMGTQVKEDYAELRDEITESKRIALELKALKTSVEAQYNALNSKLRAQRRATQTLIGGLARDLGATLMFSALSEGLEGPAEKKRQESLETFTTLSSLEEAKAQVLALTEVKAAFQALLDSDSTDHLLTIQSEAAAATADTVRKTREAAAEWRNLQVAFEISRDEAQRAGAAAADITSISGVFQQLSTDYAEDMEKTRSTVKALIRRLESAALNPEQRFEGVSPALSGLEQLWQDQATEYIEAVDALLTRVGADGTDGDAAAAAQAAAKLQPLRSAFPVNLFQTDIYFVTTDNTVPIDQRIEAQERALTNVRAARRRLEGHPLIRLCFVNPFSALPLSPLMSTLNKLELNLVQST